MIAVVKIGGHQAIVQVGETIEVDKIDVETGKKVKFETLLVSDEAGKDFQIGTPLIEGMEVEAKILEHGRCEKIRIYKMKPRKRYRRTQGHRQDYTLIEITKIGSATVKKTAAPKKDKVNSERRESPLGDKAEDKVEVKKTVAKKTEKKD